jgi:anti-sigma factor RsiW
MADQCPWNERVITAAEPFDADVQDHLASCARCVAERQAHDELLGAFRGIARPALSPHFRPQLMARVEKERRRKKIARRRLVTLRLYWIAASVVCAAVLANLTWSSSDAVKQTPVLFAIAAFVVPIALLLIALRTNPFELILQTMTGAAD